VTAGLVPLVGEEVSSASDIVGDRNVGKLDEVLGENKVKGAVAEEEVDTIRVELILGIIGLAR
jgi:hypothetical protein